MFDTSSLQILCNFSELVTRELEKDIALAKQQVILDMDAMDHQGSTALYGTLYEPCGPCHLKLAEDGVLAEQWLHEIDCVTNAL